MRDWLVAVRKDKSQYAVAAEIGIAQSTYAAYETGARDPSVKMAKKIAFVLGFDWTRFYDDPEDSQSSV